MKILIKVSIFVLFFLMGLYFFHQKNNMNDYGSPHVPKTEVDMKSNQVEIGDLYKDSVWNGRVELKNVGKRPLLIYDVSTNCGCVRASYSRRPIRVDSTGCVEIRVESNNLGYFKQKIRIFCNIQESPIVCTIFGEIKGNR